MTKDVNTATSLRTQLTKIHQIHNVQFHENMRAKLDNRDVKENKSGTKIIIYKYTNIPKNCNYLNYKINFIGIQCLNTMQNSSIQNVENNFITLNTSRNPNFTVSEERISTYFKIQNMNSYAKTKGVSYSTFSM